MHVPVYTDKISRYLLFDVLQDFYDCYSILRYLITFKITGISLDVFL